MSTEAARVPRRAAGFVGDLVQLAKPRITLLVVLTTGLGLYLSPGELGSAAALVVLAGTSLIVASANTLNCVVEREQDGRMNRTRNRPLPAGRLSIRAALLSGLVLAGVSLPMLAVAANLLTAALGLLALLLYVLVYTPLKRVTPAALVIGAVPGAMPPLMGWTAVTGRLDAAGLVLFGILFVWQIPHFIAISLLHRDDYERGGFRVLPLVRGDDVARLHLLAWTVALIPVSLALVPLGIEGTAYLVAAAILGGGFVLMALLGLRKGASRRWAGQTFAYSLVYLTVLAAALVAGASRG